MKKRGRIILALTLLCGCAGSPASNPTSSSKADFNTALPEETQDEQTASKWNEKTFFIEKNYLNVVGQRYASGYYKYYYGDLAVEEIDGGLRLSHFLISKTKKEKRRISAWTLLPMKKEILFGAVICALCRKANRCRNLIIRSRSIWKKGSCWITRKDPRRLESR